MASFDVTFSSERSVRLLMGLDPSEIESFVGVVNRAYSKNSQPGDLKELQAWIRRTPILWRFVYDTVALIEENIIKKMGQENAAVIAIQKNADEIRAGLGYEAGSTMEQMLIDNVVVCWLGVQYATLQVVARTGVGESISIQEFWERRLTAAEHRYLRASETLARVRKLLATRPALQVNIATHGGQQVNLAGDVRQVG